MSQVSYGTITITDTTDLTTYIRYAKQVPLTTASDFQETPTTDTHYIAVLSIPSTSNIPVWNSSDWKWSEFIGTDGVSVVGTREIYYLKTNGTTVVAPSDGSDISQTSKDVQNQWSKNVPAYVTNGEYWSCIQTHLDASPTWVYGSPVLNQALTDTNYNSAVANSVATHANENSQGALSQAAEAQYATEALDTKLKTFFYPGDSNYPGAYAVGKNTSDGLDITDIFTYGYNLRLTPSAMSIGYNNIKAIEIDGSTPALKLYEPSKVSQGIQTAQLDSNGLKLLKGGIEAGTKDTSNYIYIYSNDDAINHTLEINNSGNKSDWRIVAGNKFGVDKAGNLYASNANISGAITATSLTIGSGASVSGLNTSNITGINNYALKTYADDKANNAEANASYSLEIKIIAIDYINNSATLVAVPYYQGSTTLPTLSSDMVYTYQWYKNNVALIDTATSPTISGAATATLILGNGSDLAANYSCVISKEVIS